MRQFPQNLQQTVQTVCYSTGMTALARDAARTKETILQAAENLIAEKGFQALTLEEVAVGASVSKGGVLHHFPNKQALILGIAEQMISEHREQIREKMLEDAEGPGVYTRAFLRVNLSFSDECTQVCATLEAESRKIPAMLELFREYSAECQRCVENDGIDPVTASIVRYAAEGLMQSTVSGMPRPSIYDAIVARLLEFAGGNRQKAS